MLALLQRLGDRLTLVGVAHILPKSRIEAEKIIRQERPDIVAVELCPSRYALLMGAAKQAGAMEALRGRGLKFFILNRLLYHLQAKFSRRTGMPAGEEMVAAIKCAQEVGARIELIDRDVGVTLQRLINRMSKREKLRLLLELLLGFLPLGPRIELEKLTEEEVVVYMLSSLKKALPRAYEVLIEERDSHMAAKIAWLLATSEGRIICVVGAGHVSGLLQRLRAAQSNWHVSLRYSIGAPHAQESSD